MLTFQLGDPEMFREKKSLQVSFFFCNEALKKTVFPPNLHTLERGREGPPSRCGKVTFKSNSLEVKANGSCLFV